MGGYVSALKALTAETGLTVRQSFDKNLPERDAETELVVYRVAQEGLTNTARHAQADEVELILRGRPSEVELHLRDNGRGMRDKAEGAGIRGMRERALLVGGNLNIFSQKGEGTTIELTMGAR